MIKLRACIKPPPHPTSPSTTTTTSITTTTITTTTAATRSFNSIISYLSSQSSHHQVLLTFSSMLDSNTSLDAHTYPSLFKACTCLNKLTFGFQLHSHVISNGYASDSYVSCSVMGFYAGFCKVADARKVFDEIPERNVVPWTTMIGCYARKGEVDRAFEMYRMMMGDGVLPSSVTVLSVLRGVSEVFEVGCLHACAVRYGWLSDVNLVNNMLHVYAKCGRVYEARGIFEEMEAKDIVSWNSLISGYAEIGNVEECVCLLRRMRNEGVEPDRQTFATLLTSLDDIELGRLVHGQIISAGTVVDAPLATSLITFYLKFGRSRTAFMLFERNLNKDGILWTSMISGLVQCSHADKAMMVFSDMLESGVRPSTATICTVLSGCSQISSFTTGKSVHGYLLRQGIDSDTPVLNSLITLYAKNEHLVQCSHIFDNMWDRDVVSWNAIIAGFAENGDLCEGLSLFNEMRCSLQKPDSITVTSLLQACASTGALEQGKWVHNFAIKCFVIPSILVETALVDMYSKCGDLNTAQKCFDHMPGHDVVSWCSIIAGYGSHGKGEIALELFSRFLRSGLEPNHTIFLSILFACSHNMLVSEGLTLFKSMKEDFGLEPQLEHRASIVDLLCRAGKVEDAYDFMKAMIAEPTVEVLGILLDACRSKGNTRLGEMIARDIAEMKSISAEQYVQLAQSYASMDRWDEMGEAWTQMRSLGLKKLPGWSCIELHGKNVTFYKSNSSHPLYEETMWAFEALCDEMRDVNHSKSTTLLPCL